MKIILQVFLMTVTSGIPPTDQTPILSMSAEREDQDLATTFSSKFDLFVSRLHSHPTKAFVQDLIQEND